MANVWKKDKTPRFLTAKTFIFLVILSILFLTSIFCLKSPRISSQNPTHIHAFKSAIPIRSITPYDCLKSPQSTPIIANSVENLKHSFIYSLSDLGNLPDKPHKNIVRLMKGKPFRKPDISATIQEVLEKMRSNGRDGIVVDVGANVGMASFAAAVMGFPVVAFEPVLENLQRICDGVWFNRVGDLVTVFEAAASDRNGNITFHKLVGRLDNSAVSAAGAKLAFQSNEEIAVQVKTIPLDEVISDSDPVLVVKIDVQGWEHHVLKGAKKLLSRNRGKAPYLIYEEDEKLLEASNSSAKEIRDFLKSCGYNSCTRLGTDAHCTKE